MPDPGKAMMPLGSMFRRSSLRRKGAARPWAFQSGRQTIWWTPRAAAQLDAILSVPGPSPWISTISPYFVLARSSVSQMQFVSETCLPPVTATRVPLGM